MKTSASHNQAPQVPTHSSTRCAASLAFTATFDSFAHRLFVGFLCLVFFSSGGGKEGRDGRIVRRSVIRWDLRGRCGGAGRSNCVVI